MSIAMSSPAPTAFISVTPILPSTDLPRTLAFYLSLGFHLASSKSPVVRRDGVELQFWEVDDDTPQSVFESLAIRISVTGIEGLYEVCQAKECIHPNGKLQIVEKTQSRGFVALDPDGVCITFTERP